MILKVIESVFKRVKTKDDQGNEIYMEKAIGSKITKLEYSGYVCFKEVLTTKNKVAKTRCQFRTDDGWILVRHSFEELQNMKNVNERVIIKGFTIKQNKK